MSKFEDALSLRASGHVRRWHTIRTITQQTVAEHSGQAVSLLLLLYPEPGPSLNLVKSMLWHDSSERLVGDVPAPIRRMFPPFAEMYEQLELAVALKEHPSAVVKLTDQEMIWLRAIDLLELWLHCRDEMKLGNVAFGKIYERAYKYLKHSAIPEPVISFCEWFVVNGDNLSYA